MSLATAGPHALAAEERTADTDIRVCFAARLISPKECLRP